MAYYTTQTSDKSKKTAITLLLCGGAGFHLFYVGKIKAGFVRFFLAFLFWALLFSGIADGEIELILSGAFLLIAVNIIDFFKLLFGTFRDNVGVPLRR